MLCNVKMLQKRYRNISTDWCIKLVLPPTWTWKICFMNKNKFNTEPHKYIDRQGQCFCRFFYVFRHFFLHTYWVYRHAWSSNKWESHDACHSTYIFIFVNRVSKKRRWTRLACVTFEEILTLFMLWGWRHWITIPRKPFSVFGMIDFFGSWWLW